MPSFCDITNDKRLALLKEQIEHAKNSAVFKRALDSIDISSLDDLSKLPFTDSDTIIKEERGLVCIPASQIPRIVSVKTSNTSDKYKRIYYSQNDMERTISFFCEGMQLICNAGDKVAIIMENSASFSISQLLEEGLKRFKALPFSLGLSSDISLLSKKIGEITPDVIVGLPWTVRTLSIVNPSIKPRAVLLSGDYCPKGLKQLISHNWNCKAFCHYGMTETVYGLAVQSDPDGSMLLRRDEYIAEIINPITEEKLDPGETGELVLTSLKREAMPLIRYKTGDLAILDKNENIVQILGRKNFNIDPYLLEDELSSIESVYDYSIDKNSIQIKCSKDINIKELPLLKQFDVSYEVLHPDNVKLYHIGKHITKNKV